jgi:hypothetical protein
MAQVVVQLFGNSFADNFAISANAHENARKYIGNRGQMTVELAVCMPVLAIMIVIMFNAMSFLEACARFDRVAADAVRIEAASPGYGEYGNNHRARKISELIEASFADFDNVSIAVKVNNSTGSEPTDKPESNAALPFFSMLSRAETYECTMYYSPPIFGDSLFGTKFFVVEHTNSYAIDPFRPGVLF